MVVDKHIVDVITDTMRDSTQVVGLTDVRVQDGLDHDGEPVLFIEVTYDLSDTPIDVSATASLTTKLRDRLWAVGEKRFPHIRHKFSDLQKIKPLRRVAR